MSDEELIERVEEPVPVVQWELTQERAEMIYNLLNRTQISATQAAVVAPLLQDLGMVLAAFDAHKRGELPTMSDTSDTEDDGEPLDDEGDTPPGE